jgi:adenine-specific DNA-methyltransferase
MDEVFGAENFVGLITVRKTTSEGSTLIGATCDYLVWYAKDCTETKYHPCYLTRGIEAESRYDQLMLQNGTVRSATFEERNDIVPLPDGSKLFRLDNITSSRPAGQGDLREFEYEGQVFTPGKGTFKTDLNGMNRLASAKRLQVTSTGGLSYRRFADDFGLATVGNLWSDISGAVQSRSDPKVYVVQTSSSVVSRCLLMTTDPGDLILDPTCGSGTSAFVAEQWGRRWITCDVSRVPLALARQRLLTATFPYFELKEEKRGPVSGFIYERKQNKKGEEVGGIVPHIMLESIANNEPPKEEVLVDRPEIDNKIVRITGPFAFEATIPTPVDYEGDGIEDSGADMQERGSFVDRMLEVLRQSPVIQLPGNKSLSLKNIRLPSKTLSLSAEALVPATEIGKPGNISDKPLAIVFGPESGAVSEKLVYEAAKEANAKSYSHLLVIGFAIQPNARDLIEKAEAAIGIPATYVQMTPDLMMGDLLKNMRSSQIFSVCGLPDVKVKKVKDGKFQVELLGLDIFDPSTMEHHPLNGDDVPAWFLDTDYNGLCFHVCQAFFPRTGAWESLKKALKGSYEESVWDHLAGTLSEPFEPGEQKTIAVKVIDDRGNELLVTKALSEASK